MLEKYIDIKNETGLNARASSALVKKASEFKSQCFIIKDGNEYNCKSIIHIMSMLARKGDKILLRVEGSDQERALKELTQLIKNIKDY